MFRMRKIFKNDLTLVIKIAGKITDENMQDWTNELRRLSKHSGRRIILDICEVTSISPRAVQVLADFLTDKIYLLNCPVYAVNMLQSAGLGANILS